MHVPPSPPPLAPGLGAGDLRTGGTFDVFRAHPVGETDIRGDYKVGYLEVFVGDRVIVQPDTLVDGAFGVDLHSNYVWCELLDGSSQGWLPVVVSYPPVSMVD